MPITTSVLTTSLVKILSPIISDIYGTAKGSAASAYARWSVAKFPRKLAKHIASIGNVKTLRHPETDISLLNFYYPSRVIAGRKPVEVHSLDDLGEGNLVIQGIVGQGKSIFLRYLALRELMKSGNNRIPIFLELRTLTANFSLRAAIYKQLAAYEIDIDDASFSHLAQSGRTILMLDGFDELEEDLVRATLLEISFLAQRYPTLRIIVSSRPSNEVQKAGGFKIIRLRPIAPAEHSPFLRKLGLSATQASAIKIAIERSPAQISGLISTPLMLNLVVIVYEYEREIPPTLPEFFERLFQVVFSRHDRFKAGFNRKHHTGLSDLRLQNLFEAFCFMTLQNGFGRSLSSEQFAVVFDQAQEYSSGCSCELEDFRLDIVKVACLMLEEGVDTTTFLHKSLLEYYAASFIKHSIDDTARLFYAEMRKSQKGWTQVIRFLGDIDPYRYAKDFALGEYQAVDDEFIAPILTSTQESDLLRKLLHLHPNFGGTYYSQAEDQYRLEAFGDFNLDRRIAYEDLDDLLIRATEAALPATVDPGELEEILGRSIEHEDFHEEHVGLSSIFSTGGAGEFRIAVEIFAQRIREKTDEMKQIIEEHEKRRLIFSSR